jgi:hypothetical protein
MSMREQPWKTNTVTSKPASIRMGEVYLAGEARLDNRPRGNVDPAPLAKILSREG